MKRKIILKESQLKKSFEVNSIEEGKKTLELIEREVEEAEALLLQRWSDYEKKYGGEE